MPDSSDVFRVRRCVCYEKLFVSSTILLRELRREVPENLRKSEKISLIQRHLLASVLRATPRVLRPEGEQNTPQRFYIGE